MFCCTHTCYCVSMVSVTSASFHITSASRHHPRYQIRSSMFIHVLFPRNFAKLAEAVPIGMNQRIKVLRQDSHPVWGLTHHLRAHHRAIKEETIPYAGLPLNIHFKVPWLFTDFSLTFNRFPDPFGRPILAIFIHRLFEDFAQIFELADLIFKEKS